jgi:uncharacterized membrane protein YcaP (DUF421 family)
MLILRIIPRRIGNIMAPFEYVLLFLLGGLGVQGVIGDDRSLMNAALAVSTVALMHTLVAKLKVRSSLFSKIVDGTPMLIMKDGRWDEQEIQRLALLKQDILAAARQKEIGLTDEIRLAIVERNGAISLFKQQSASEPTKGSSGPWHSSAS